MKANIKCQNLDQWVPAARTGRNGEILFWDNGVILYLGCDYGYTSICLLNSSNFTLKIIT